MANQRGVYVIGQENLISDYTDASQQTSANIQHLHETSDDSMKEACGVVGVYARGEEAARATFFGLYALQHRGQESAGIAASDGLSLIHI